MLRQILATVAVAATAAFTAPVFASCYGTGYSRYCDGVGGYGATYSPRGDNGSTTYYNRGGGYSRTQTYSTTPSYGGGYTRTKTTYYGY